MFKKWLPLVIALTGILSWLFVYRDIFFAKTDLVSVASRYSTSQYVLGDAAVEVIPDYIVYTYAASEYVKGVDPTTINFEHPPLGKYILGLSLALFGNVVTLNFLFYCGIIYIFWQLLKGYTKHRVLQIVGLLTLLLIKLIPDYVFQGMLDTILLFWTMLFIYVLLFNKTKYRKLFAGLALGVFMSTKYFIPSVLPLGIILLYVAYQEKKIRLLLEVVGTAMFIYLISYLRFFVSANILEFIQFEWYRFRWWTGERTMPKFLLMQTIFLGKFKGWWATDVYEYAKNWNLAWPILFLGWLGSLPNLWKKKNQVVLAIYASVTLVLYLFGAAANERYLIQLIPFWIIGVVVLLDWLYGRWKKEK